MIFEIGNGEPFEGWRRWTFLQYVLWKHAVRKYQPLISPLYVLRTCRLVVSARTPCTIGKENLPSVRSSAKPLFDSY